MGRQWKQCQTLFWGAPKSLQMVIAAMKLKDGYSLEGKMTNLDSILKNRDITLSTKVRIVKAMVFPVVMYGCESSLVATVHGVAKNWTWWSNSTTIDLLALSFLILQLQGILLDRQIIYCFTQGHVYPYFGPLRLLQKGMMSCFTWISAFERISLCHSLSKTCLNMAIVRKQSVLGL